MSNPKPGGGTPPPITTGNFVSWSGGRGRVDMIVSNGKVPGVDGVVEGTAKSPAARVVVWEKNGDTWKPSRKKIGASTHTLKRIAPLNPGKSAGGGSAIALIELLAQHDARVAYDGLGESARVDGAAVKAVYERGLKAYPEGKALMTREEWAEDRVSTFLSVAAGAEIEGYTRDLALLPKSHRLHPDSAVVVESEPMVEVAKVDLSSLESMLSD